MEDWPALFFLTFLPTSAMIVLLCFLPESPRHLLYHKRVAAARDAVRYFHAAHLRRRPVCHLCNGLFGMSWVG